MKQGLEKRLYSSNNPKPSKDKINKAYMCV